jgi:hypothetical protein
VRNPERHIADDSRRLIAEFPRERGRKDATDLPRQAGPEPLGAGNPAAWGERCAAAFSRRAGGARGFLGTRQVAGHHAGVLTRLGAVTDCLLEHASEAGTAVVTDGRRLSLAVTPSRLCRGCDTPRVRRLRAVKPNAETGRGGRGERRDERDEKRSGNP